LQHAIHAVLHLAVISVH